MMFSIGAVVSVSDALAETTGIEHKTAITMILLNIVFNKIVNGFFVIVSPIRIHRFLLNNNISLLGSFP